MWAVNATTPPIKSDVKLALAALLVVSEAIREVKQVPSGTLYAMLCAKLSLDAYSAIIRTLEGAGVISVKNRLITWTGPTTTETKGK